MADKEGQQEAPPAAETQGSAQVGAAESSVRLLESTLYKENVFVLEHTTVWGSFYDSESKRWGYKCCKIVDKQSPCTCEKAPAPDPDSSELDNSPDSEDLAPGGVEIIEWKNPPKELLPRESFKVATQWLEHFVRFYVGEWQRKAEDGYAGFGPMEVQTLKPLLKSSMEALEILVRRLHNPRELDRSEKEIRKGRETRAGMEGKVKQERSVLTQLDEIATNSSKMDYLAARAGYMKLTLGNKTWNNTFVTHVAACTMKGAREYRRNRDNFNTYDMDPDSQKYMHALLKLVQLAQCLKPNSDQSKNNPF